MKPIAKQFDKKAAFTIVELLTVMSIIIILIGMLVPALNQVRRFARKVEQKNQFHTIDVGLDLFHAEWDGYPPSNENDNYCGAMKLAEAMVGQDLMGFHPDSDFTYITPTWPNPVYYDKTDLSARRMHLKAESTSAYRVDYLYPNPTVPYDPYCLVLCDVYTNVTHESTGRLVGMPILYYSANTAGTQHPTRLNEGTQFNDIDSSQNFYNYKDNDKLVKLGMPWDPPADGPRHPLDLYPVENFYYKIWNEEVEMPGGRPYKQDSYILLSAGFDGKYGTGDDVFNFEK